MEPGNRTAIDDNPANPKLLVVDDEQKIRACLIQLGNQMGMEVQTAEDGVEGFELFETFKPDIVIIDIYMPRQNGLIVLRKIKEIDPGCPVILITGYSHYKLMVESRKIAPDGFALKPFQVITLARQINDLLEKRAKGLIARRWLRSTHADYPVTEFAN